MHRSASIFVTTCVLTGGLAACKTTAPYSGKASGLASVSIAPIEGLDYDEMQVKLDNQSFPFPKGQSVLKTTVKPGDYMILVTASKDGAVIASSDYPPCKGTGFNTRGKTNLKSGPNPLKVPVCTADKETLSTGAVPDATLEIQPELKRAFYLTGKIVRCSEPSLKIDEESFQSDRHRVTVTSEPKQNSSTNPITLSLLGFDAGTFMRIIDIELNKNSSGGLESVKIAVSEANNEGKPKTEKPDFEGTFKSCILETR